MSVAVCLVWDQAHLLLKYFLALVASQASGNKSTLQHLKNVISLERFDDLQWSFLNKVPVKHWVTLNTSWGS